MPSLYVYFLPLLLGKELVLQTSNGSEIHFLRIHNRALDTTESILTFLMVKMTLEV